MDIIKKTKNNILSQQEPLATYSFIEERTGAESPRADAVGEITIDEIVESTGGLVTDLQPEDRLYMEKVVDGKYEARATTVGNIVSKTIEFADGGRILELDIEDYIDTATNTGTINCQDLDSRVEILNFVYPPATGEAMVKNALEILIINISSTKIKRITFAPSTSIVTSSTNKDYTKVLSYFRFKLYKTTIEEYDMYFTATSGRVFVVIRNTGFSYTPEDTGTERITSIGLYKNKYSFYFERDVLTEYVDKLFFFDANVIFSTRLDTGVYDQRFLLKMNYSICLFVDVATLQFALHSEDTSSSSTLDGVSPLGMELMNMISATNLLIKEDGVTEIETLNYYITSPSSDDYLSSFFFNHFSYVTSAYLNSGRVSDMKINNVHSTNYTHYTFLQIGVLHVYFQGYISNSSSTYDYRNCTLKSIRLLTFRCRAIIKAPDVVSILPILYMNAYFYES